MKSKARRLQEENEVLKNRNKQLKQLYLAIKSENQELKKLLQGMSAPSKLNEVIKITDEVIGQVLNLREQGLSYRLIANQTGISKTSVGKIINENKLVNN